MTTQATDKPRIALVTPALAQANNGNWHTAARWADFLSDVAHVELMKDYSSSQGRSFDAMIALHARRSAASIAAFAKQQPNKPIALVLTGTDVYRDIASDTAAQRSLELASKLIILQARAADFVPPHLHHKLVVIEQSAEALTAASFKKKSHQHKSHFQAVMVGHLREEKAPLTFMRAAARLRDEHALEFVQVGAALEEEFGALANDLHTQHPRYRWLGNVPRDKARQLIRDAHLLVIPSVMEGGAHVIIEALQSGTPVLASRVSGNIGMLGEDYAGYFPLHNDEVLAALLRRAAQDTSFYATLMTQCAARAPLFEPSRERAAVIHLAHSLLHS